jgi:hypothetical protein
VGVNVGVGGSDVAVRVAAGVLVAVGVGLTTVVGVLVAEAGGSRVGAGRDVSVGAGVKVGKGGEGVDLAGRGPQAVTIRSASMALRTSCHKRARVMASSP